jgi:hypothetical protein
MSGSLALGETDYLSDSPANWKVTEGAHVISVNIMNTSFSLVKHKNKKLFDRIIQGLYAMPKLIIN